MNELASLGLILLFALLVGHLVKVARIPEVTGYLLAGVLVGPSALGLVSHENLQALHVFSEVGLGLILFSIGAVFELSRMREIGKRLIGLTLAESLLAAALVSMAMLVFGQPWQVALLLGAIAVETGAASTLMVIRENNAAGPFTETLTGVIGMNNIFALVAFSLVAATLDLSALGSGDAGAGATAGVAQALFPLVWQLVGSAALGFLVGLLLASWASQVVESGEVLILLVGCVLLTVGAAALFDLSALVASLAVGATMANLSSKSRHLFDELAKTDPPLYVIFFVLAGADLNLALLPSLGMLGVAYVACRAAGKLGGAWFAARRLGAAPTVQRLLGFSIFAQAGLAVGLVLVTRDRFPEFAPTVTTVVLGAVVVFEVAGPLSARLALDRSGESRPQDDDALLSLGHDDPEPGATV
jgi:Kef-type K+ transport system membrane component KefB